jgi:NTP pyrophosphatase (non-canonical NTP hydrolase)
MQELIAKLDDFVAEREWEPYHAPKNLAMALSVEVAEIVEIFQWMAAEQSHDPSPAVRAHLHDEIGDVLIYLAMLARKLDIDPLAAAHAKLEKNRRKYPAGRYPEAPRRAARDLLKD